MPDTLVAVPPEPSATSLTRPGRCAWCTAHLTSDHTDLVRVGAFRYRTGPIGPLSRRIVVREERTRAWPACQGCAPLVREGDVTRLATRTVIHAAVDREFTDTADMLPHSELVGLFRCVNSALQPAG